MQAELWKKIDSLCQAALAQPPEQRAAFLAEACPDDPQLRAEVQSLLDQQADSFLEGSPFPSIKALIAGTNVGNFEIVELLGRGGMGEVYRARDLRLKREVAIKMVPPVFAASRDRIERFEREARSAAAINHPNICTLYEVGEHESHPFLVMELLEGATLAQRIGHKPLPLEMILNWAVQIADGLDAAHARRIIHRDIKPANLFITTGGQAKILDFGLAKLAGLNADVAGVTAEASVATDVPTTQGTLAGTPGYMSPEQVRGEDIDARTDLFSLGVVLYEMATGRLPFAGKTSAALMAAILHDTPESASDVNPEIPLKLQEIIARAIEKDPALRHQSAADLRAELKRLKRDTEMGQSLPVKPVAQQKAASPSGNRWKWALLLAALLLLGAILAIWLRTIRRSPDLEVRAPEVVPFTTYAGKQGEPAFSPDGNEIAFTWDGGSGGKDEIYVKLIGSEAPLQITNSPSDHCCAVWSPDGKNIAFMRLGTEPGIFSVGALGGPERKLVHGKPFGSFDWSPDGKSLIIGDSPGLTLLSLEDGEERKLTSGNAYRDFRPVFSPDGQNVAFSRLLSTGVSEVYVIPISGGLPKRVTSDNRQIEGQGWTEDGREIVYSSLHSEQASLWRIPIYGGQPRQVLGAGLHAYRVSVARRGHRLAYTETNYETSIWRFPTSGGAPGREPTQLIASTQPENSPDYSPDGKRIVFASTRSGQHEIWMCDSQGRSPLQLTSFNRSFTGSPRWSPDGKRVAFDARPRGHADIYVVNADGGTPRLLTADATKDNIVPSWSSDGRWIYFASNRAGPYQIWKEPADGGQATQVTKNEGFDSMESSDAKFLYYQNPSNGGLWRTSTQGGEGVAIPELAGTYPRYWSINALGIYFIPNGTSPHLVIKFFEFKTRRVRPIITLDKNPAYYYRGLSVSPDGQWLLCTQTDQDSAHIRVVENFR